MLRGQMKSKPSSAAAATKSTASAARSSPSPSPSRSPILVNSGGVNESPTYVDGDSGSEDDDDIPDSDEDAVDDEEDGVADDIEQIDANGHVLNDGDELLDEEPPMQLLASKHSSAAMFEEKQNASRASTASSAISRQNAYTLSVPTSAESLLVGSPSMVNLDGSRRLWLCPSKYGRPAVVYFDYPLAFGMRRNQEKIPCEKTCTLRFLHADSACIYNSITGTLKRAGFIEQEGESKKDLAQWNVRWGKHMHADNFRELRSYQKINHFPGTGGIARKDRLARNINRARRKFGGIEYNFLPETYLLPADRSLWEMKFNAEPSGTLWIAKPNSSSCGRGIRMVSKLSDISAKKSCIVSRYIANPLLVNQRKFDLRIYVLVTSYHPLKVYLYQNGLARFCTSKYDTSKKNLKKKYIHLTNFSVNKKSKDFIKNNNDQNLDAGEDGGDASKWSLVAFKKYLIREYGLERSTATWAAITDIFIKTFLSIEMNVSSNIARLGGARDQCFELYGFDILLDSNLKPWLMEVNAAPSLSSSSPLDKRIKNELLTDTFHTAGIKPAYVKEKEKEKEKEKKKKSGGSEKQQNSALEKLAAVTASASTTSSRSNQSQQQQGSEVVRGGTMGPSNSRNSRAASAGPSSWSGNGAGNNNNNASGTNENNGSAGGRIGKLKSTPLHVYYSNLSRDDLALLREFQDELSRAHSGKWRVIFPVGASNVNGDIPPHLASLDAYSHLFEVEKYDTLLLMKFAKHFSEETRERICQGFPVELSEVMHADAASNRNNNNAAAMNAGNGAPGVRRAPSTSSSTASVPSSPSAMRGSRPATTGFPGAPPSPSNSSHHKHGGFFPTNESPSSNAPASPSPSSPGSVRASLFKERENQEKELRKQERHRQMLMEQEAEMKLQQQQQQHMLAARDDEPIYGTNQRRAPDESSPLFMSVDLSTRPVSRGSNAASVPNNQHLAQKAQMQQQQQQHSSDDENSNFSPLGTSPEDSDVDEHGRVKRRYFYEQGVALQPFVPHTTQYHEGWATPKSPSSARQREEAAAAAVAAVDQSAASQSATLAAALAQARSPKRSGSRPVSAARAHALAQAAAIQQAQSDLQQQPHAAPLAVAVASHAPISAHAISSNNNSGRGSGHVRSRSSNGSRNSTGMIGLDVAVKNLSLTNSSVPAQHQQQQPEKYFSRPSSTNANRMSHPLPVSGHAGAVAPFQQQLFAAQAHLLAPSQMLGVGKSFLRQAPSEDITLSRPQMEAQVAQQQLLNAQQSLRGTSRGAMMLSGSGGSGGHHGGLSVQPLRAVVTPSGVAGSRMFNSGGPLRGYPTGAGGLGGVSGTSMTINSASPSAAAAASVRESHQQQLQQSSGGGYFNYGLSHSIAVSQPPMQPAGVGADGLYVQPARRSSMKGSNVSYSRW